MSIWWFLWIILSFVLLGTTVWSLVILFKQKKAWSAYAKRHSLIYTKGTFSGPCEVEGNLDGFKISLFTALQQKEDSRKNRQLTVLQLILPKPFVKAFAAGTQEMLPFLNAITPLSPHSIENSKWDSKANHIFSKNKEAVDKFLTEERVVTLNNILKLSNSDILIIISDEDGVFRFETTNPLTDLDKIEKLISKLMANIKALRPDEKEIAIYKSLYKKEEEAQE